MPGTRPTRAAIRIRRRRTQSFQRVARQQLRTIDPHCEFNAAVNRMSNRQRSKWAKAGYPGLRNKEVDRLGPYAPMERVA